MPHYVASDLALHCLPMTLYGFPGKNGLTVLMKALKLGDHTQRKLFAPLTIRASNIRWGNRNNSKIIFLISQGKTYIVSH